MLNRGTHTKIRNKMEQKNTSLKIYRASAGSGKTFRLAVEYITLLIVNPMEYQNILAVTFTNKATTEMKQRILSTLYGISVGLKDTDRYMEPILENVEKMKTMPQCQEESCKSALEKIDRNTMRAKAKEALENIIHDYSRFRVETIDSFFQGIVREIASELDLSVNMKVEIEAKEVLSDAVDEIIDNLDEGSNEYNSIVEFIEEKIRSNRSWKVAETVKAFGSNIFKENYLINDEEVRRKVTNYESIKRYHAEIKKHLNRFVNGVNETRTKFAEVFENEGFDYSGFKKTVYDFLAKICDKERTVESLSTTFSDSKRKLIDNADEWLKKGCANREEVLEHVDRVLSPLLKEVFDRYDEYTKHQNTVNAITKHLYNLMLLNKISEKVKELNSDANRFLLSETANFLRNVINDNDIPFIYEKTGSVIKHIMIDEFQDTSALQWENFKPLILNCLSEKGSGLIVGDVKQSIYRFRNSDWRILNGINNDKDLKGEITEIPAKYNYRSSRNVVKFNNDLFENAIKLLQSRCSAITTAYKDVMQIANKKEEVGYVKIENIDYHSIEKDNIPEVWEKETPADCDEAMLHRIQVSVKELLDNGVSANDITILVRKNREVPEISDYFATHRDVVDVKVVSNDAFRLDASPAVNIIIDALRALASNDDKLHLATLAYSYQAEVLNRQEIKDDLSAIFLCEMEEIDNYLPNKFRKWERRDIQFLSLTEQIENIYQIFQLHRIEGQDAYLFFFNDLAEQFCEDNMADLDTFLQIWDEKLCKQTIPNGVADGVRIMTMHKSKGLEFHSVIIPSCSWKIAPKDAEVIWCKPKEAPYSDMPLLPISISNSLEKSIFANDHEEEELRTLVDNVNVLYVAFTRAKNNLVILTGNKIGNCVEKTNNASDLSEKDDASAEIDTAQSFLVNAMPECMKNTDYEGVINIYEYGKNFTKGIEKKEEKEVNVMECEYAPRMVTFQSHPSVAAFRQSYESDLFITSNSLNLDVQSHNKRIRLISLGNLYHNIFQLIHTIDDVPHAVNLLQSKGCFGTMLEAEEAQKKVTELIEGISTNYPEWFSSEWTVLNERAILSIDNNNTDEQQKDYPISRRPDRVIVNGNKAIVIDYKTAQGVVKKNSDGTYSAPSENKKQIEKYVSLLREMGYENVQSYLWYIFDNIVV